MKILVAHHRADRYAAEIVGAAMCRSFTSGQVRIAAYGEAEGRFEAAVLIRPGPAQREWLAHFCRQGRKALVLGRPALNIARFLGLRPVDDKPLSQYRISETAPCPLRVRYMSEHPLGRCSPLAERPLWRFDFADEWNNLGFGRIALDGGDWSLAGAYETDGIAPIAQLFGPDGDSLGIYAGLRETSESAVLWFNRAVGPVDSLEWRVVEAFFGDYRAGELTCWPYLSEIPAGYRGAVTMRLDCDEAVASARPLFEAYAAAGLPLSLAVVTGLPMGTEDFRLLREVAAAGGAVVSHSVHHPPDWGGNYSTALAEAKESKGWLEENLPEIRPVSVAVSPFHQNSPAAVNALADAGYIGFVGGIIRNDPEFLLGRAGRVSLAARPLLSHSQQCMLHGDCWREGQVYLQSWENHLRGEAIFGYLDHPFSARYQYGWATEAERIQAHAGLLRRIVSEPDIWRPNLDECFRFLRKRDDTIVSMNESGQVRVESPPCDAVPSVVVRWQGRVA